MAAPSTTGVTTALVLGGGGLVGEAFHAGALAALEHDLGWDARDAGLVVGTSAGAIIGALLRLGLPASDLAAHFVGAADAPSHQLGGDLPTLPPMRWQHVLRPRIPTLDDLRRGAYFCLRNPLAAWLALVRDGSLDVRRYLGFLETLTTGPWTQLPLWITATRQRDARRVVFGTGGHGCPSVLDAVAASCAVPGYFAPVEIDGDRYVDGGAHSATNADLVASAAVDLTIVVSPMSTTAPIARSLDGLTRYIATRRLRDEIAALEAAGQTVIVLEPDAEVVSAMGNDLLSSTACADTVLAAYLELGRQATRGHAAVRHRLGAQPAAA